MCSCLCRYQGAEETASQIINRGGKALAIHLDVTNSESWKNTFRRTVENFGTVHILCNIAGISEAVNIVDLDEEDFDRMIGVNLKVSI